MTVHSLKIVNEKGLHARASARFVEVVEAHDASAEVVRDGMRVSGDSIMGLLMLGASRQTADGGQAAMSWVVGAYFFHTVGELCLSPVGLSAVSKLAPARFASLMMGVWLLSSFVANYLAGLIGGYSERLGEFTLFATIVGVTAAAGAVLIALSPVITKRMHNPPLVVPTA